ncbi:LacI family DNA-binding transcriptional regulator [uncultured Cohaesibacter sp.]|uniref:LacI family DNA-binding transcriptional regulator n=1 Tax=uncultured Cohaesibacter sp. TaxID=1002546 RepID=UPI00292E9C5A|nr:LacI family DNA-binding transcriptional regulator [uncultured Cohaesibacter sp.]
MTPKSRPTQQTIAQLTGFAITTVSKALRDDPKIAEVTRKRVAQVAAEIGYIPDRAAQRLRTGKTKIVSLILDPHDEILGFGNSMISGIVKALNGSGYNLTMTPHFSSDPQSEDSVFQIVRNGLADGLLFSRTRLFDERVKFLFEQKFPFVTHGRTEFAFKHSFVDYDNEFFAYQAARRLIDKGCKHLTILLPASEFTFYQHMHYGFARAVRENGVSYSLPNTVTLDSPIDDLTKWGNQIAKMKDMPDGIICPGELSFLAFRSGMNDYGKLLGRDYQVVVKSNSPALKLIDPSIDRIGEDIEEEGYMMGKNLLQLMDGDGDQVQQTLQQPQLLY